MLEILEHIKAFVVFFPVFDCFCVILMDFDCFCVILMDFDCFCDFDGFWSISRLLLCFCWFLTF